MIQTLNTLSSKCSVPLTSSYVTDLNRRRKLKVGYPKYDAFLKHNNKSHVGDLVPPLVEENNDFVVEGVNTLMMNSSNSDRDEEDKMNGGDDDDEGENEEYDGKIDVRELGNSLQSVKTAYRRMEDGNGALSFFIEFREKYKQGEIGKDDDGEDWEKEFKKLERFTVRVCYQIMRCWLISSENKSSNVLRFLINMDNAGIPLTRAELERLVWACTREDHYIVVKELYIRIRE
ncbi:pentatricopeptide repeat-containing protein, partial [Trifolium medium]|nr:pentatricopeptide repeat-containing protein [Trifolium medium]